MDCCFVLDTDLADKHSFHTGNRDETTTSIQHFNTGRCNILKNSKTTVTIHLEYGPWVKGDWLHSDFKVKGVVKP